MVSFAALNIRNWISVGIERIITQRGDILLVTILLHIASIVSHRFHPQFSFSLSLYLFQTKMPSVQMQLFTFHVLKISAANLKQVELVVRDFMIVHGVCECVYWL